MYGLWALEGMGENLGLKEDLGGMSGLIFLAIAGGVSMVAGLFLERRFLGMRSMLVRSWCEELSDSKSNLGSV